jgi:undecaprenyl-diphosphatase
VPILHALVLGVVQGLTEFLPISSSGHLVLVPWLFRWEELRRDPGLNQAFDVALHMGTFVGAAAYFRHDLVRLGRAGVRSIAARRVRDTDERLAWLLLLSALPAALTGALLDNTIEDHVSQEWLIGLMLVLFGMVLLAADRLYGSREGDDFRAHDAVVLGVAQALALQPGVSRSGVTISAARWRGFDRTGAARISFLMSLPIIAGAGIYKGIDVVREGGIPSGFGPAFAWGTAASAVTGFLAVWGLLRLVRTRSFFPFVAYRVAAGVAVMGIAASSWR